MDVPVRWIFCLVLQLAIWTNAEVTTTQATLAVEALASEAVPTRSLGKISQNPPKTVTSDIVFPKALPSMSELIAAEPISSDKNDDCGSLEQNVKLNQQLTHVNSQLLNQVTQMVSKNAEVAEAAMQTVLSSTAAMAENSNLVRDLTLATQSNARAIADVVRATQQNTEAISVITKILTSGKGNYQPSVENEDVNIARRSVKRSENDIGDTYFTISLTEKLKEARDNLLNKILPKQTMTRPPPTPLVITDEDLMPPISVPDTSSSNTSYTDAKPTSRTSNMDTFHRPFNPKLNIKTRSCVTGFLKSENNENFCSLRTGHTWESAKAWCEAQGLNLAQPKDLLAMSKRIQAHDSQSGRSWVYWLGGRGTGKSMMWLNGNDIPTDDPVWRTGHPGYSTSPRDCLAIQTSTFSHHGLLRAFSCESDNIYVICS